jgi:Fur family peroxide stress response transcriptional regulator
MLEMKRSDRLRELGLTPTIQRMAVLDCLEKTKQHPTADQVLVAVRKTFPTVSRATVYNTLEVMSKAGLILKITVDPAVARYDADTGPHAHFRCRVCNTVYDVMMDEHVDLNEYIEGHHVEAVRAYAYGVCAKCLHKDPSQRNPQGLLNKPTKEVRHP